MSKSQDLVTQVLEIVGDRAEAGVYARTGTSALTRFANSFIHQNVSDDVADVHLTISLGGKVASGSTTSVSPEGLGSLVERTIASASDQSTDETFPGFGGPVDPPKADLFDEATAAADPAARAEVVKTFVDAGKGLLAAGMCETMAFHDAYANTSGRRIHGRSTKAILDGIHQTSTTAGSGHSAGRGLGDIAAQSAGEQAAARARMGEQPFDTKPGEYEVVLAPEAMATIAEFLSAYGFNGKAYNEGQSFVNLGESRFDESIQLFDDIFESRAMGMPFDAEGTPRARLDLIVDGSTPSLVHDRRSGLVAESQTTGHAALAGESWSGEPATRNLFIGDGELSEDSLIAQVERGIYVATFNYCRVLDPKTVVVTGLTRNGTFMIENGVITGAVTNLRFTQSFIDALGQGNVGGVGRNGRFANAESEPGVVHAPSAHLRSWNFTGGAAG
jgi:predicted Zn-dependent protease